MGKIILITGGARSGKSSLAQEIAIKAQRSVLFVATAVAGDDEMQKRIIEHRRARPAEWITIEACSDIGYQIKQNLSDAGFVIIDCITMLLNNIFNVQSKPDGEFDYNQLEDQVDKEIAGLLDCITDYTGTTIIVTNEVGLGIVPGNQMTRYYRDLLGRANRMLAQRADEVLLLVSGIPVRIK